MDIIHARKSMQRNSVNLDGINDNFLLAGTLQLGTVSTQDLTFVYWEKRRTTGALYYTFGHRDTAGGLNGVDILYHDTDDSHAFFIRNSSTAFRGFKVAENATPTTPVAYSAGVLRFWVWVWTPATITAVPYLNAEQKTGFIYSTIGSASTVTAAKTTRIGARSNNTGFYPGSIGQLAMYRSALNATQITNLYKLGPGGDFTSVVASPFIYYRFDTQDYIAYKTSHPGQSVTNRGTSGGHNLTGVNTDSNGDSVFENLQQ